MAITIQPIITSPKSLSHMQVVIDRLKKNIDAINVGLSSVSAVPEYDGTAAVDLALGDIVYPDAAGSLALAVASAVATSHVLGVITTAASAAGTATVQLNGIVTVAAWSLTTNTIYYLDPSTAGDLTATAPTTIGQVVQPVGIAVAATKLMLLQTPLVLL